MLKSRLKDLTVSSFKTYNSPRKPNNLTPEEFESLLKLSKNKNAVIQKSDKGNSVVLIDKILYTNGIKKLIDNPRKFEKLSFDANEQLNFIFYFEQIVIDILKEIKNKNQINEDLYNNYAQLVVNLESFMVLPKSIKKLLMVALLFDQFFQPLGQPRLR